MADARYDDAAMSEHYTFLFAASSCTVIDAAHGGNDARFVNYCCAPNCKAVIDWSRVFIDAVSDIAVGEELFYDYEFQRSGDETAEDEALYRCACGAATCRGSMMESRVAYETWVAAEAAKRAAKRAALGVSASTSRRPWRRCASAPAEHLHDPRRPDPVELRELPRQIGFPFSGEPVL